MHHYCHHLLHSSRVHVGNLDGGKERAGVVGTVSIRPLSVAQEEGSATGSLSEASGKLGPEIVSGSTVTVLAGVVNITYIIQIVR